MFASASDDRKVKVCSITGELLKEIDTECRAYSAAFSPDNKWLAIAEGKVKLYGLENNFALKMSFDIDALSVYFMDTYLIVFDSRGWIKTIDLKNNIIVNSLSIVGSTTCIAPHPDGQRIASTGRNGVVRFWDINQGDWTNEFGCYRDNKVFTCIAYHPSGLLFATGSEDGTIVVWNDETNYIIDAGSEVNCIDFSPCGEYIVSGHQCDQMVKIWKVQTKELVKSIKHDSMIQSVKWV